MLPGRNPKYAEHDLPIPAIFYSKNNDNGWVTIESAEEEHLPSGQVRRKQGTGYQVEFHNHQAIVHNSHAVRLMLKNQWFRHTGGFNVHPQDPNGFWREFGIVKEKQVTVCEITLDPHEKPDTQFKAADLKKKLAARLKEQAANNKEPKEIGQ